MKSLTSFTLLLCCLVPGLRAQPAVSDQTSIIVYQPEAVDLLIEKHIGFLDEINIIEGWQLQIESTTKLNEAVKAKAEFIKAFRDIPAYISFDPPNYNLRIGAYLTKVDAYSRLSEIRNKFPKAFPVMGYIKISDI